MQISRSNVQQRRGRAGRCRAGKFYKLYSQYEFFHEMGDHELPEMLRIPVEELCLQAKSLTLPGGLCVKSVLEKAISPPESLAVENAVDLLTELAAFGNDESMTPLGWQLSQLPVHPCLGKMLLLGSLFERYSSSGNSQNQDNILLPLISICSTLSFKSPFVLPFGKEKEADRARKNYGQGLFSDHLLFAKVSEDYQYKVRSGKGEFGQWLDRNFLSKKTLEMTGKIQHDLERHLKDSNMTGTDALAAGGNGRQKAVSKPLLSAILAASLSISFTSPGHRKLCSSRGGLACSVHPSSLLSMIESAGNERMLWKKYKHLLTGQTPDQAVEQFVLDYPDKIFILGWFERLKTSELYLRDCTLFSDPLPLLLLLPGVQQRSIGDKINFNKKGKTADPTIFELLGGKSSQGGDWQKDAGSSDSQEPTLLLKVQDEDTAQMLSELRLKLTEFFGAVLSKGMHSNLSNTKEEDTRAVFRGLKSLIEQSYSLYVSHDSNHGRRDRGMVMDPEVFEVRHLHDSAHCKTLESAKNAERGGDNVQLDDDMEHYGQDRDVYRHKDEAKNSWRSNNNRHQRGRGKSSSWGGGGNKRRRGQGRQW